MSEFDLISQYFKQLTSQRSDVILGIGDDCALLNPAAGMQLAVSTDTLNSGIHFPHNTAPEDIGFKALAVNLSDLAAMGAKPAWVSLNLSLPDANPTWLQGFCNGFVELADRYGVQLIGGDTTRGSLSITVQVYGFVEPGRVLRRDGAQVGDRIYVSGSLGDAGLGLRQSQAELEDVPEFCIDRLNRPQPRVELGLALLEYSRCAIDVSDGLLADLGHILEQSRCGAQIELDRIPLSGALARFYGEHKDWASILSSGDDYELCFTVAEDQAQRMQAKLKPQGLELTEIGVISQQPGLVCVDSSGQIQEFGSPGYNHFQS